MKGRPDPNEAAERYFHYINLVDGDEALAAMERQVEKFLPMLQSISEERSLHRYAPDKWSMRQALNHLTDTERAFAFRALWFARGFDAPLPGYDPDIAARGAVADVTAWSAHLEEFRRVRQATISMFQNLPAAAWMRTGVASGYTFTVRALAWIIPGHVAHHVRILQERYL